MITKDRIKEIGENCAKCGRPLMAGVLLCLCLGVPGTDHAPVSDQSVVIAQQVHVRPDLLADRPESWHLPERDFTVHSRGVVRDQEPPPVAAPPWVPQMVRHRRSDPSVLLRMMRGTRMSQPVPPAAPWVPQMSARQRFDPGILRHSVARGSAAPVSRSLLPA